MLAARLTTTKSKPSLPSIVELGHPEAFVGVAACDDIVVLYDSEVLAITGALSAPGVRSTQEWPPDWPWIDGSDSRDASS